MEEFTVAVIETEKWVSQKYNLKIVLRRWACFFISGDLTAGIEETGWQRTYSNAHSWKYTIMCDVLDLTTR